MSEATSAHEAAPVMEGGRKPDARAEQSGEALVLHVSGTWRVTVDLPNASQILEPHPSARQIRVVPETDLEWDSSLPLFLMQVRSWCQSRGATLDLAALPNRLKDLFRAIQESEQTQAPPGRKLPEENPLLKIGRRALAEIKESIQFVGECALALLELPADPRQVRWKDFVLEMVDCGPKALPIVGLLSFLIGVVFAYETATQLRRFSAQIYVVNALGVAVVRQIGPTLAAVILAGRTGAAFAAHLGNMKVGGEIDALKVLGVSPISFLVLPRLAALFWMMPLITIYADLFGLVGGQVATVIRVHIPATEFWVKAMTAITMPDIVIGLVKAVVFGVLVGLAGTLRGLQCERSAGGVGRAATSAVVTGIAAIIAANTLLSPIIDRLGR